MVAPAIIGAGISAGAGLAGGILNLGAQNRANKTQERLASEQMAFQQDLATQGIRWRVNDAKKAGIHPLYALGANIPSYAPVSTAFGAPNFDFVGRAGQDVGRAVQASLTPPEKTREYIQASQKLALERGALENQILAARLAKINQPGTGPGVPSLRTNRYMIDGQGETARGVAPGALVKDTPLERVVPDPARPWQEPGAHVDMSWARTPRGYVRSRSKDVADRGDDDTIGNILWSVRNRFLPTLRAIAGHPVRGPYPAPPGKKWSLNPLDGTVSLVPHWPAGSRKGPRGGGGGSGW